MTKGIASINIHHGGHGSTMAAILAGQPSIVIPFQMEQEIQARETDQLREAIGFKDITLTEDDIIEALEQVQEKQYRIGVNVLKEKCEHSGGSKYGVDLIENLVK